MRITYDNVTLRDYQLSDVEDEVRWTNVDTEWFYADTPWMTMEQEDPDQLRADMIEIMESMPEDAIRTLGIEICEMDQWGKGIGTKALTAAMEYYRSLGERHFLLETWSGNQRMLGCAGKLGFAEVKREKGAHIVDGKEYDALVLEKWFLD